MLSTKDGLDALVRYESTRFHAPYMAHATSFINYQLCVCVVLVVPSGAPVFGLDAQRQWRLIGTHLGVMYHGADEDVLVHCEQELREKKVKNR